MAYFRRYLPLGAALTALVATSVLTTGCTRTRNLKGYLAETILIDSIEAGVDNRVSVAATLGRPSFESQFNAGDQPATWYYVSRTTRQLAFARPSPIAQNILAVQFDASGNVTNVRQIGLEQVASISPYGEETPTLGRSTGFFQELFGNIGQVGASGRRSGGTADNPNGS